MKVKTIICIAIISLCISCVSKGKPSAQGKLLTAEELKSLANNPTWNGKLVAIEGYPSLCSTMGLVKQEAKNKMDVYSEPDCNGEKIIVANIVFGGNTVALSGEKERNFVEVPDHFTNKDIKMTTPVLCSHSNQSLILAQASACAN